MACANDERLVDIGQVVASKFGGKKVPAWMIFLLKKILHQDYINHVISRTTEDGIPFCGQVLDLLDIKVEVEGLENIPDDGTLYTFASNHPLGGADGITLCSVIGQRFGDIRLLVNDFLMFVKPLAPMCIPVNKVGGQARNLPALVNEAFHSDKQLLIFPAGLCSRKTDGVIRDLAWSKTFVTKSVESGRAIVPVHFIGRNSERFYRVANICKRLGIKFNLAMLLLPDEMYRAIGGRFKVIFGKPIPSTTFDKSKTPSAWAATLRQAVYDM